MSSTRPWKPWLVLFDQSRRSSGSVLGRGEEVTSEIRSLLSELAVLADRVARDEQRILDAALERLKTAQDKEERRVLGEIVGRARLVLGSVLSSRDWN